MRAKTEVSETRKKISVADQTDSRSLSADSSSGSNSGNNSSISLLHRRLMIPFYVMSYIFSLLRFVIQGLDAIDGDCGDIVSVKKRKQLVPHIKQYDLDYSSIYRVQPMSDCFDVVTNCDSHTILANAIERNIKLSNREKHREIVDSVKQLVLSAETQRHQHCDVEHLNVHKQPNIVYISDTDMSPHVPDTFVAKIVKILSPTDANDITNRKVVDKTTSENGTKNLSSAPSMPVTLKPEEQSCYVRVFVKRRQTVPLLPRDVQRRAVDKHALLTDQLRRQFNIGATDRIRLQSTENIPSEVSTITLYPLFDLVIIRL